MYIYTFEIYELKQLVDVKIINAATDDEAYDRVEAEIEPHQECELVEAEPADY